MKKVFSILTVIILITSMLHVSVARHYCGGELAASKISLSGVLASCGMEGTEESCPRDFSRDHLKSHCCDDIVTFFSVDNIYTQSQTVISESYRFTSHVLEMPIAFVHQSNYNNSHIFSDVSPPDSLISTAVDLSDICVFRI